MYQEQRRIRTSGACGTVRKHIHSIAQYATYTFHKQKTIRLMKFVCRQDGQQNGLISSSRLQKLDREFVLCKVQSDQ